MSAVSAGAKSSATVQQMQPLASSMIAPSGQAASAQPLTRSPSTPTSPNSLMMSARRRPPAFAIRWRMSVVLPAPRKPVTIVTGVLASIQDPLDFSERRCGRRERRRARDDALAERERPFAPWNDPLRRGGVTARRGHNVLDMRFAPEIADDVGPFARRGERDGARPLADGQAFDRPQRDVGLVCETLAECGEQALAKQPVIRFAGDADEKGGRRYVVFESHWGRSVRGLPLLLRERAGVRGPGRQALGALRRDPSSGPSGHLLPQGEKGALRTGEGRTSNVGVGTRSTVIRRSLAA